MHFQQLLPFTLLIVSVASFSFNGLLKKLHLRNGDPSVKHGYPKFKANPHTSLLNGVSDNESCKGVKQSACAYTNTEDKVEIKNKDNELSKVILSFDFPYTSELKECQFYLGGYESKNSKSGKIYVAKSGSFNDTKVSWDNSPVVNKDDIVEYSLGQTSIDIKPLCDQVVKEKGNKLVLTLLPDMSTQQLVVLDSKNGAPITLRVKLNQANLARRH